jgi:hypothetical protein
MTQLSGEKPAPTAAVGQGRDYCKRSQRAYAYHQRSAIRRGYLCRSWVLAKVREGGHFGRRGLGWLCTTDVRAAPSLQDGAART